MKLWAWLKNKVNIDRVVLVVASITLAITSFLLLTDQYFRTLIDSGELKVVAYTLEQSDDVRRRLDSEVVWFPIRHDERVFQGDSIFTGDESHARIQIKGGGELKIQPRSLVRIFVSEEQPTVSLQHGQFTAKLEKNSVLRVQHQGKILELKSKDAVIQLQGSRNQKPNLQILSGSVEVTELKAPAPKAEGLFAKEEDGVPLAPTVTTLSAGDKFEMHQSKNMVALAPQGPDRKPAEDTQNHTIPLPDARETEEIPQPEEITPTRRKKKDLVDPSPLPPFAGLTPPLNLDEMDLRVDPSRFDLTNSFTLTPLASFSKLATRYKAISGATTFISKLNTGLEGTWTHHWTTDFESYVKASYLMSEYEAPKTRPLTNDQASTFSFSGGIRTHLPGHRIRLGTFLGYGQTIQVQKASASSASLGVLASPFLGADFRYEFFQLNSTALFTDLSATLILGGESTDYTASMGYAGLSKLGLKHRFVTKEHFIDLEATGGYSLRLQSNTVAAQTFTEVSFGVNLTFHLGNQRRRGESRLGNQTQGSSGSP